jgi:hypothetical protein
VQQADRHAPAAAVEAEDAADGGRVQDRLVDDIVLAVATPDDLEAA